MQLMNKCDAVNLLQKEEFGCEWHIIYKGGERPGAKTALEALQIGIQTLFEETEIRKGLIYMADFVEMFSREEIHQIIEAVGMSSGAAGEVCTDVVQVRNQEVIVDAVARAIKNNPDAGHWILIENVFEIVKVDTRDEELKQFLDYYYPGWKGVHITLDNGTCLDISNNS